MIISEQKSRNDSVRKCLSMTRAAAVKFFQLSQTKNTEEKADHNRLILPVS